MLEPTREHLLHLLSEAAELEHNLLCSYLFALFSLKTEPGEDLSTVELETVGRWRRALLSVCVEEMVHLAQVANLTTALGARPHFNRPNIPVAAGYHPAAIVVRLSRFDLDTLQHFVHLERPEGTHEPDGESFWPERPHVRRPHRGSLMPSAPDYDTIGEFYEVLRQGLVRTCSRLGEAALFIGPHDVQLQPGEAGTASLKVVTGLASACEAIDEIVVQGEGSPEEAEGSHYAKFLQMRAEYRRLLAQRPGFEPSRPVGTNPVMRVPAEHQGRTHVTHPQASQVLDAANALYTFMLRCLTECYRTPPGDDGAREAVVAGAFGSMRAFAGIASELTTMPATENDATPTAGVSFAMPRATEGCAHGVDPRRQLAERLADIRSTIPALPIRARAAEQLDRDLADITQHLG